MRRARARERSGEAFTLWLALAYLAAYVPYSALARSLASGFIPGIGHHAGMVILPATALGQLAVMPVFLLGSGWWRYGHRRRIGKRRIFWPRKAAIAGGSCAAVIIGTTTLNLTFPGVSILLMLLLMRAGTLTIAPIIDRARGLPVRFHSWAAVAFSLLAAAIALSDVDDHALPAGAVLSLVAYLATYAVRFDIMGRVAKSGVTEVDRRYLVGEHATAPVFLILLLAAGMLLGNPGLQEGFTAFLRSPAAVPAMAIGVLYECLFVFGTLVYLDPNAYSWAVPVNRCASLISGLVASFALAALTPAAAANLPGPGQLAALWAVIGAVAMLCYPLGRRDAASSPEKPRSLLFVCGGNTCRSPMAEAIAREEIAVARAGRALRVSSAGVSVATVGAPMTREAVVALGDIGIEVRHRTRPLSAAMCRAADAIYCMTRAHREAVLAMAPDVAGRTFCLDPDADISDPIGQPLGVYEDFARRMQLLVRARLAEQPAFHAAARRRG